MNKLKTLTLAVAALSAASASAFEFKMGPIEAQLNTSISYGIGMRTADPDLGQIHPANANKVYGTSHAVTGDTVTGSTYNYDDGTLNFEKNDIISNVLKGNMDLELVYGNAGGFLRGSAFYDSAIMDQDPAFKDDFSDETKDAAGMGYDLLDAFVWYNFDIGNMPVSARLGRQVVSWGESTFIFGGMNSINPLNASAIRKPGVEIKEVLLPVNMAYGSFGLTDTVTLEAFYQLEWEKTRPDACGTFFSTNDLIADGCGPVILGGAIDETEILSNYANGADQPITERITPDDEPSDDGQFGFALRWYAAGLGDTEFGLYHMNIHSRLPLVSGQAATAKGEYPLYQVVYPEDIKLTGISFNRGTDSGWSIGGEISVKQDYPIQWNTFELILGGTLNEMSLLLQDRGQALIDSGAATDMDSAIDQLAGQSFDGFDRYDVWQAQMTFIKFFDQVAGASRLSFVSEIGATFIPDLPGLDEARYGRSGAYGIGTVPDGSGGDLCLTDADGANINPDNCTNDGYVDELSAGIRTRVSLDYPNALLGANLKPEFSLGYDYGTAPEPGGAFVDGRIKTSLALKFDYLNRYSGGMAYTMFDGSEYDQLVDRDNVTINLKVTF